MSLSEAQRRCPHGIFIEGHYALYREYSDRVMAILFKWTPKIEILGIDEAYLDVTDIIDKYPTSEALAQLLKQVIFKETKLPCSIGIAASKTVAKIASGLAKPNGIYYIPPGKEMEMLAPLPIQTLPGVGVKTQEHLNDRNIKTIGDIQKMSLDELFHLFGAWGYHIYYAARGIDKRTVEWEGGGSPKSIGAENTFETDVEDHDVLLKELSALCEKAWRHLIENRMHTGSITLKLRNSKFKTVTRARQLLCDTNSLEVLQVEFRVLFEQSYGSFLPLRLIGVSLHKLTDEAWQPSLFD
jgi:DNA polymerase IV